MFQNLSERLGKTIKNLSGQGRLSEDNIKDTMRDVRIALLEADVALPIVKEFIEKTQEVAIGKKVIESLNPGQALVGVVRDELTELMGKACEEINLSTKPPAVILMAGLQGSGKTTTTAKLAKLLKEKQKKTVMVTSADVYRPAAIEQLATLAKDHDIALHESHSSQKPAAIVKAALKEAKKALMDVLIIDTAGRLHIDDEMMKEIKSIHKIADPAETFFVVDSMTGQDAANTAQAFNEALPLTGVVLTKVDGDARGGAALSIRKITEKPIKFIGVGEKIDEFEAFHPERIVSRILGMGDILSLVEDAETKLDEKSAKKLSKKIKKGAFDLEDFRDQLKQISNMGGMMGIMGKLPGMGAIKEAAKDKMNDKTLVQIEAIINSMTPKERRFPQIIKSSRKRRIAGGSGSDVPAVNRLLKQFGQMQKMMKKLSKKGGMKQMMRSMQGMMPNGSMPPELMNGMGDIGDDDSKS